HGALSSFPTRRSSDLISMSWRFCALRRFWVSPREHFVNLPRANGTPKKLIRWTASLSSTAIITIWPLTHISSGTQQVVRRQLLRSEEHTSELQSRSDL